MELNLARDMKGVEKERRKTRGILVPLLNEGRHLVAPWHRKGHGT